MLTIVFPLLFLPFFLLLLVLSNCEDCDVKETHAKLWEQICQAAKGEQSQTKRAWQGIQGATGHLFEGDCPTVRALCEEVYVRVNATEVGVAVNQVRVSYL